MIQRIQTLYLSLVVLACAMMFFFPMAEYVNDVQGTYIFYVFGVKYLIEPPLLLSFWLTFPLLVMIAATGILSLVAIFLFKNRRTQNLLVSIAFLLHVIFITAVFLFYMGHFDKQFHVMHSYRFGVFIPLVSLGFLILASRSIRKDESMVKSADRLR
jgi:hypothetical protein